MKKSIFFALITLLSLTTLSAQSTAVSYQLSTHILDINKGAPAAGVKIALFKYNAATDKWNEVQQGVTDDNGRIKEFLPQPTSNTANDGIYKLKFFTQPYFAKQGVDSFYPFIEVVFSIKGTAHYHVPITLSPFGYSTYRGS